MTLRRLALVAGALSILGRVRVVCAVVGVVVLAAPPAAVAGSWSIESTPNPGSSDALSGVACLTADTCTAVGRFFNGSGSEQTFAAAWDGATWTVQNTPNSATTSHDLSGVSCSSPTACTAVGSVGEVSSPGESTLAERWDGTSWTIQSTPNPPDSSGGNELRGVSCPSSAACTAVGQFQRADGSTGALAESWDGTSWTVQSIPIPTGVSSGLEDVSCTSATACTAVGWSADPSEVAAQETLAERWDGSRWTVEATLNPLSSRNTVLTGVSCTSATACTAVGTYDDTMSQPQKTLAETWNGIAWTLQSTPNPAGVTYNALNKISCAATSVCTAVGYSADSSFDRIETLAEGSDGTSWTIQRTPNPAGFIQSDLFGVSCARANRCTAVGQSQRLTLAEAR